jgi:lipid-binding SYLF domain-containing protein
MSPGVQGTLVPRIWRPTMVGVSLLVALFAVAAQGVLAAAAEDARKLVAKAEKTIEDFRADPDMTWFRDHLPEAKAVLVVPVMIRAGFIFGGSGGHGALLWRDATTGLWSYPAFYFMGSVSFGLQIGVEAAEVVLMIMTTRGRDAFLSSEFKLGADISVAAGPVGAGVKAATADVIAFSRDKGLFGGLTIEGAVIEPRDEWNKAYYGKAIDPTDILVRQKVANPGADPLREAIARARDQEVEQPAAATPSPAATPGAAAVPSPTAMPADYDVAIIQQQLQKRGYDPGPADGVPGPKTRQAISQYESDAGLPVTGRPSVALQQKLTGAQ